MTDFLLKSREAAAQGDAFAAYRLTTSAVEADPENVEAWYGLGCALHEFKKFTAAVVAFRRADLLRPGHHETLTNLGLNLGLVGRYEEAEGVLLRAVLARPAKAPGHLNLANVMHTLGRQGCTAQARKAVDRDPESILAHMIFSFCLMADGEWQPGFAEYEWRFKYKLPEFLSSYPYPIWRGEETGTLVVVAEQGLGDAIHMMRFLPEAAKRSDRIIWLCHKELLSLGRVFVEAKLGRPATGHVDVIPLPASAPPGDAFIPMLSLPVALGMAEIGGGVPYIKVESPLRINHGMRVGLVWAGDHLHDNAKHRDASLEAMLPLTEIPDVHFSSLQIGPARSQIDELGAHALVKDLSTSITSLLDTAREIAGLDLVITVDTAVAHLAGAMGKECWMLVNQRARDWRWGRSDVITPWYPSILIWPRQIEEDTWARVIKDIRFALRSRSVE